MMHGMNQYRGVVTKSVTDHVQPKNTADSNAHAIMVGYILLIRRLYQLGKLPCLPKNKVKPEQKKNNPSPIAPPVTSPLYWGNNAPR